MTGDRAGRLVYLPLCAVLIVSMSRYQLMGLADHSISREAGVEEVLTAGTAGAQKVSADQEPALTEALAGAQGITDLWVSAASGNDGNDGFTPATAFRSIQKAADIAVPGTTVHILPGLYRESVRPALSGTSEQRVTYRAENGPGTVTIRGSEQANTLTWSRLTSNAIGLPAGVDPANLYFADLSAWALDSTPRFVVQLSAHGDATSRLPLAREPDWQVATEWKYAEFWWAADGGSRMAGCNPATSWNRDCDLYSRSTTQLTDRTTDSQPAGIQPGNLTTLGSLTGATLVAMDTDEGHYVYRRKITAHDSAAGKVTVDRPCEFDSGSGQGGLGWGSKYFVENLPSLLDTPGEWWYDTTSGRLYLWPPASRDPAAQNIEISRRSSGFDLTDRSYTTLDGLTLEFFNRSAVLQDNNPSLKSYNNTVRNSTMLYANIGVDVGQGVGATAANVTNGFTLEDSHIGHMDTYGLELNYWWPGATADTFTHSGILNTTIRNNEFYDLGFRSDDNNGLGIAFFYADRLRFEGNYVHHVAQNGVAFSRSVVQSSKDRGLSPSEIKTGNILVKDNIFEKACLMDSDCGELKIQGSAPDYHVFRDLLITGNVFRNTVGWTSISEKRERWSGGANSQVKGMGGFGLYVDNASGVHAYRNISYNNAWSAYHLYEDWWDGDVVYYNNIAANSLHGFYLGGGTQSSTNTQIANNIIVNAEGYGFWIFQPQSGFGNFVLDHNLYFNNGWLPYGGGAVWQPGDLALSWPSAWYQTLPAIQANTPWEDSGVEGDPGFAGYDLADHNSYDGSWPDFHLTSASANALDRGTSTLPTTLSALLTQFGVADSRNGAAYDIGRYESELSAPVSAQVAIGGAPMGSYELAGTSTARYSYPGVQDGPVQVHSGVPVLASERGTIGPFSTFNEVMGYPNNQLTNHYWFPWYDDVDMITWVLVGNPSTTQTAIVSIKIAGTLVGSWAIPPFGNVTPRFGIAGGPVEVTSNINVFASQRVLMGYPDGAQSFDEVLGYPHNQLTTHYWFTWYDNKDMLTWVLVGNPSATAAATVTIKIAGATVGSYSVAPLHTINLTYPGVQNGPVEVLSNRTVFASERGLFGEAGYETFNEVVGYPHNQLTTNYWFPWYDNQSMIGWVLVGNPSTTQTAQVTIKIAGVPVGYYSIPPFGNVTPTFAVSPNGPVQVTSNIPVFTSERVLKGYPGRGASFNEILGIANTKLTTDYWFTWYDDKDMTTDIMVGRP